ncbi:MAG: sulfur carrier protein ThiS [Planctomycetales bacterium]|nr:sulfur carrier protein ThiS [Planctomycetales bacterium]
MSTQIICNGEPRRVEIGATVADLLGELGLEARHVAVEVNLEVVPRAQHAARVLADGDRLEVVSLVGGG